MTYATHYKYGSFHRNLSYYGLAQSMVLPRILKLLKLGYSIFKPIQNSAARFFGKFLLIPETLASHELGR